MENVRILPGKLKGTVEIPTSKSQTHRAILCAAMADGESTIRKVVLSDDIRATIGPAEAFGARVAVCRPLCDGEMADLSVVGKGRLEKAKETIDCRESGSTLRFAVPLALTTGETYKFIGRGKLPIRPMGVYYDIFERKGIEYENEGGRLPLTVRGSLKSGTYTLEGNVSSQFVTGLMLALPQADGTSRIVLSSPLESGNYVDMTIQVQESFGVSVKRDGYRSFEIERQKYKPADVTMEGDYSQGAFWLVAGILGERIAIKGLKRNSCQGDSAAVSLLESMGGMISEEGGFLVAASSETESIVMDASDCPDIVPIMAVAASLAKGTTRIVNAERLRYKESDRLLATASELRKLGADIEETSDGLVIHGVEGLEGGVSVWSHDDHRIAMAMAVASSVCRKPVVIEGMGAVTKSYPHFMEDFKKLGGKADERDLG